MKTTITKNNRAVVINQNGSMVWANVYVNVRQGIENADITAIRWEGNTVVAAERWANRQLATA